MTTGGTGVLGRGRRRGYAASLALVLAAGLGLAGCEGGTSGPDRVEVDVAVTSAPAPVTDAPGADASATSRPPERASGTAYPEAVSDDEIVAMVSAMDEALAAGDLAAFLEHVSPELQEEQQAWFEAVRNVPMDVRELRGDRVVSRQSPTGTVLHVGLRHRITGGDAEPVLQQYRWVVAPGADGPVLVETRGRNGDFYGYPQLWDEGQVAVLEGQGVVVLAPERSREDAEALLPGLERAAEELLADFPVLAESQDVLAVQLVPASVLADALDVDPQEGWTSGLAWLHVAPTSPDPTRLDLGRQPEVAPRVMIDVDVAAQDLADWGPAPQGDMVLRYFGSAAVLQGRDVGRYPVEWVALGVPEWYAVLGVPDALTELEAWVARLDRGADPERLPSAATTQEADPEELAAVATGFVLYLAEEFGQERVLEVAEVLGPLDGWYDDREAAELLTGTLGASEEELLAGWRAWREELAAEHDGPDSEAGR